MKHIFATLFLAILFLGCNSDNSDTSVSLDPVIHTIIHDGDANITSSGEVYTVILSVTDQNNEFINGDTIKVQGFDAKYGSFRAVNVPVVEGKAIFEYNAPEDIATLNKYTFIFKAENSDASVTWNVTFTLPTLKTLRVEIPTLTLNAASEEKIINILAYGSDNKIFSGANVIIKDYKLEPELGYFTANSAKLIDGVASFTFKGPDPLLNQKDKVFTFETDDGKSDSITIKYDPVTIIKPTITDVAHDGNITVSTVNEPHVVTLSITDENGLFINDGTFNVKGFNSKYGSFSESSVEIKNGRAVFNYTSPSDLTDLTDINFTFIDSALNKSVLWNVTFKQPKLTTLKIEKPSIILTDNAQSTTVKILAYDENNEPINKQSIVVKNYAVDPAKGYFTRNSAEIIDGIATFTFVGPNPLKRLNDSDFTLQSDRDTALFDTFNVKYQPTNEQKAISRLEHDGNVTIISANKQHTVTLFVKDSKGNFVTNGTIEVEGFGSEFGSFSATSANVVEGKAIFTYTAPQSLKNLNDFNFTFQDKNSNAKTLWKVDFQPALLKTLQVEEPKITVDEDAQEFTIKVIARDQNGKPFNGKNVIIQNYETNTTIGYFNSKQVELVDGVAEFIFIGPKYLINYDDTVYEFKVDGEAIDTNATVKILYRPNKPDVGIVSFDENSSYIAKVNGESIKLNVLVSNAQGSPMLDGVVRAIYPNEWSKTDVGVLLSNTAEVIGGRATFEFRAPNDMEKTNRYLDANGDQNSADRNFTKWFFSYNDTPASDEFITINYRPDANQTVITNYTMEFSSVDVPNNIFPVDSQYTFTVKLLDQDGNLVTNSDTNISVELKSSLLGILENNNTTTNKKTLHNSNSLAFVLQSKENSGTVPVVITIDYTDNNGNKQTIIKAFSVIVQSGPATSMSISLINTEVSDEYAGFKSRYEIKVVDKYGNLINSTPTFSTGVIAGYAGFDPKNPTQARFTDANNEYGQINKTTNEFNVTNDSFDTTKIEIGNDILVTYGQGYTYDVSGKFAFTIVDANRTKLDEPLTLLQNETNISYALGHNFRQVIGTANEAVARVVSEDGNYTINSNGSAIIDLYYDAYLVGKDVVLWANLVGDHIFSDTNRSSGHFGEAKVVTLPGTGISVSTEAGKIAKNSSGSYIFYIGINDSPEDYRNGHFLYATSVTGTAKITGVHTSQGLDTEASSTNPVSDIWDYTDTYKGYAFVRVFYSNFDTDETNSSDSSISVKIIGDRVTKEFQ